MYTVCSQYSCVQNFSIRCFRVPITQKRDVRESGTVSHVAPVCWTALLPPGSFMACRPATQQGTFLLLTHVCIGWLHPCQCSASISGAGEATGSHGFIFSKLVLYLYFVDFSISTMVILVELRCLYRSHKPTTLFMKLKSLDCWRCQRLWQESSSKSFFLDLLCSADHLRF